MTSNWRPDVFRARARRWWEEADASPPGRDREASINLAKQYERLAVLVEKTIADPPSLAPLRERVSASAER